MVRDQIGAVASLKRILVVNRLPKTRSGKILRRVMRSIVAGEKYQTPSTIDDPVILDEIEDSIKVLSVSE
jgi:propionyl-CoA synthetase